MIGLNCGISSAVASNWVRKQQGYRLKQQATGSSGWFMFNIWLNWISPPFVAVIINALSTMRNLHDFCLARTNLLILREQFLWWEAAILSIRYWNSCEKRQQFLWEAAILESGWMQFFWQYQPFTVVSNIFSTYIRTNGKQHDVEVDNTCFVLHPDSVRHCTYTTLRSLRMRYSWRIPILLFFTCVSQPDPKWSLRHTRGERQT